MKCYVYAKFSGGWAQEDSNNTANVMSHMACEIMYAVCTVLCCSRLQRSINLSTIEAEHVTLIQAIRELIPFMALMKEVSFIFDIHISNSEVFCKVFEDNQIYIAVVESKPFSSRTKHIAIKYHHFQSFTQNNMIWICYINTREQKVDILTKPFYKELFIYIQGILSGL